MSLGVLPAGRLLAVSLAFAATASAPGGGARRVLPTEVAAPVGVQRLGRVAGSAELRLAIALPLRNQAELAGLLHDLYDPRSPLFHRFLTVEQFTQRFGATEDEAQEVARFAERQGMAVRRTSPNRLVVDVTGPVEAIEQAFGIEMGLYRHTSQTHGEDRTFFAPNLEPTVEPGVPILSVVGLTDRVRPHPLSARREASNEAGLEAFAGSGPGGTYLGSDMRAAYAPGVSLDGAGQAVALFELGPYNLRNIHHYFGILGQPLAVPIVNVLLDGVDGGVPDGGDDGEVALDIEQAISMAPNLSSLIVYESYGDNATELDVWNQIATDNVAKQISSSWAYGPIDTADNQVFLEYGAQGQNLFQASGDNGAYSAGMRMEYPTDNPNLVSVGGTHLRMDAGNAWESEVAWYASGGGVSTNRFALPGYQLGVATADNGASSMYRNVPDVCAEADFDNYVCFNDVCFGGWGGTSFAAPRWAGFLALVNQQAQQGTGAPIGFLNPSVYGLARGSSYDSLFHDITKGNDFNRDSPDLYSAEIGYDLVTGWGSPTGQSLIDALAPVATVPNFALVPTPAVASVPGGQSAVFSIALQPLDGFDGVVDLSTTVVGTLPGITATLSADSITASGSVNLTVSTTSATPQDTFQVVVTGKSGALSQAAFVTVGPQSFFLAGPRLVFVNQASTASLSVGANGVNGFSAPVSLTAEAAVPEGVSSFLVPSTVSPSGSPAQLTFAATADAGTGLFSVKLTGAAGELTDSVGVTLAVSAATGMGGAGLPVDLSPAYNKVHIATDGAPFSGNRRLNNDGYAYSANLLTPARILDGVQFIFGLPNTLDSVAATGQTLQLPAGSFTTLWLLAAGINGAQPGQNLIVGYTDRTGVVFTQTFSDWDYPGAADGGEIEAVAMRYRTIGNGTLDANLIQNLYAYRFPLNPSRVVSGLTLPNNPNLIVHAITLTGPGAVADAGAIAPADGGSGGVPAAGCNCASGGAGATGDASLLGLALLVAVRRRGRQPPQERK